MALRSLQGNNGDDDAVLSSINVIPFVDIVLVLLVIFMLTSAAIVRASLKVELPRAATGGARVESTLNFTYTLTGDLLIDGEKRSLSDAAALVRRESAANPRTQAVISADRGVEYGKVIEIIDLVKQNGITTFALDVERAAPAEPAAEPTVP